MSQLNVDIITGRDGQAAPEFTKGAIITGVVTATTLNQNVTGDVVISNNLKATGITTSTGGFVGNVTGNVTGNSDTATSATTAIQLENTRTIGGVLFDGTANINLAGVNTTGNQDTTGTAALATNAQGLTGTPAIVVGDITAAAATFSGNVSIAKTLTYEDVKNIDSVGIVTAREGVFIPDSKELKIGNTAGSPDLKIHHDTTDTWIVGNTGSTIVAADSFLIKNKNNSASLARFTNGSDVKLYFNNGIKVTTTNTGVVITGIATATSFEDSLGSVRSLPQNNTTGAYTLVKADAGKHVRATGAVTLNQNIFSTGDIITIYNNSGSDFNIIQGTGVTLYNSADATTGNKSLKGRGICTILCESNNGFVASGDFA